MKTKLTLFIAVLAVALFGMGCASVVKESLRQPVVQHSKITINASKGDGLIYLKGSNVPFTGTVQSIGDGGSDGLPGRITSEYQVQDGLLHGYRKTWGKYEVGIDKLMKYQMGKLVFKKIWDRGGKQTKIEGFNLNGSPMPKK